MHIFSEVIILPNNLLSKHGHQPKHTALDFFKYIGPGFLVTIGFIDPGNWASNVSAGSSFGYSLLWVTSISTLFLIILQHNSAHLGIATGYCLSEASTLFLKPWLSKFVLSTAILASISTAFAEILGSAIALNMLFNLPIKLGILLVLCFVMWMLFTNSYRKIEKWIIGFVSIIGLSFIFELSLVKIEWGKALVSSVMPIFPKGSMLTILSVLGAVVMPHNLYLHSEIIQSRRWNLSDEAVIKKQLRYEFLDTSFSMMVGWLINSAMILVAAATFFTKNISVNDLTQTEQMLRPMLGNWAAIIFAIALLLSGISAAVTAGMASGSIFAGVYAEPYDINDRHTKIGVAITIVSAAVIALFIKDLFKALVYSQMLLSIQLPVTIFVQLFLTSSKNVMHQFKNSLLDNILLWIIGIIVVILNIALLLSII